MELFYECRNMIKKNLKEEVDDKALDILSYAVMALVLTKGELVIQKTPDILNNLDIYAEDRPVIDIAHERLSNYNEDDIIENCDACVTRILSLDDDNGDFISEKRALILSLKKDNSFNLISRIIHEFVHLLRFGGIKRNGDTYKIKDGISIAYYDILTNKLKRKHYNMEEGIVQYYTNSALKNLSKYIIDNNIEDDISNEFMKKMKKYKFNEYLLQTTIINSLCTDKKLEELIDDSFVDENMPVGAITYFNDVLSSNSAFTELSKEIDAIVKMKSENEILTQYEKIKKMMKNFLIASSNKKQKKLNY